MVLLRCAFVCCVLILLARAVPAAESLTFSGDVRVRNESLLRSGSFSPRDDINRARVRARIALNAKLDGNWYVGLRLATWGGTTSANQDLDVLNDKAEMYLDRAFAMFRSDEKEYFSVLAGRSPNPYLHSPMMWDSDYNPDGLIERLDFKRGGTDFFLNLGQHVLGLEANKNYGPVFYGAQPGFSMKRDWGILKGAIAYYMFVHAGGTNDVPVESDYTVADLYLCFKRDLRPDIPFSVWIDAFKNTEATGDALAYGIGTSIGSSEGRGKFKGKLAYMSIDADALWINLGDANFSSGLRDEDMHGFVLGTNVGVGDRAIFGVTWYYKEARNSDAHEDQIETDLVLKF